MSKQFLFFFQTLICFLLFSFSCTNDLEEAFNKSNFELTYISACGWCSGSYELNIINNKASFQYHAVCDNVPRNSKKELTNQEIEELNLNSLFDEIKVLNIDKCGICYDGCDETITISKDNKEYSIRFTDDKEVNHLKEHLLIIRELFEEMNAKSLKE